MTEENGHYRQADIDLAVIKKSIIGIEGDISELLKCSKHNSESLIRHEEEIKSVKASTSTQWGFIIGVLIVIVGATIRILIGGKL